MELVSRSIPDTSAFAQKILSELIPHKNATVLALYGDLGSGKTTFVQELGKLLGIKNALQSPTFVIMKSFDISNDFYKKLFHIDAYRLEKPDELARLGFRELLADPTHLIAVEWVERVEDLIPQDAIRIRFKFVDETTREIEMLE